MHKSIKNRYDFMLVFDVKDGNPNGDPDAGNLPRMDSETGHGLVTDVCLKRKVRNFVQLIPTLKDGLDIDGLDIDGLDIFVKEKAILNNLIQKEYDALGIDLKAPPTDPKDGKKRNSPGVGQGSEITTVRQKMCEKYYDIRTFGAVMSTGPNAGQVRGPVQLTFGRSVDPIVTLEHSITRMAVTNDADAEKERTMGRKNTVPYGLYVAHGFISPALAAQTGFGEKDLELLWVALVKMFDHDHSAARGMMATQKLLIFKHDSPLGKAPSHKLFDMVKLEKKEGVDVPRSFADYNLTLPDQLMTGVELIVK